MQREDTDLDAGEVGKVIGALALIGAILGIGVYVVGGLKGQPVSSGAVWKYALGGAALILAWGMVEWIVRRIAAIDDWHTAGHSPAKRMVAYLLRGAAVALVIVVIANFK